MSRTPSKTSPISKDFEFFNENKEDKEDKEKEDSDDSTADPAPLSLSSLRSLPSYGSTPQIHVHVPVNGNSNSVIEYEEVDEEILLDAPCADTQQPDENAVKWRLAKMFIKSNGDYEQFKTLYAQGICRGGNCKVFTKILLKDFVLKLTVIGLLAYQSAIIAGKATDYFGDNYPETQSQVAFYTSFGLNFILNLTWDLALYFHQRPEAIDLINLHRDPDGFRGRGWKYILLNGFWYWQMMSAVNGFFYSAILTAGQSNGQSVGQFGFHFVLGGVSNAWNRFSGLPGFFILFLKPERVLDLPRGLQTVSYIFMFFHIFLGLAMAWPTIFAFNLLQGWHDVSYFLGQHVSEGLAVEICPGADCAQANALWKTFALLLTSVQVTALWGTARHWPREMYLAFRDTKNHLIQERGFSPKSAVAVSVTQIGLSMFAAFISAQGLANSAMDKIKAGALNFTGSMSAAYTLLVAYFSPVNFNPMSTFTSTLLSSGTPAPALGDETMEKSIFNRLEAGATAASRGIRSFLWGEQRETSRSLLVTPASTAINDS